MCLTGLVYLFLPRAVMGIYTSDPGVLDLGARLLFVAGVFQIFDAVQVVMTGALRGLGETRVPMLANIAGHYLLGLPVGAWLAFGLGWGALGLWIGLCLGLCFVAAALLLYWRKRSAALLSEDPATAGLWDELQAPDPI
jgi:MATE family multidrug resistance protein